MAEDLELQILDLEGLIEELIGRVKDKAVLPLYRRALQERRASDE